MTPIDSIPAIDEALTQVPLGEVGKVQAFAGIIEGVLRVLDLEDMITQGDLTTSLRLQSLQQRSEVRVNGHMKPLVRFVPANAEAIALEVHVTPGE